MTVLRHLDDIKFLENVSNFVLADKLLVGNSGPARLGFMCSWGISTFFFELCPMVWHLLLDVIFTDMEIDV